MKYAWMVFCLAAIAQEEKPELEKTVVVTVTKQERALRELPVSASVLDKQDLEERSVVVAGEELKGIPGIAIREDGAGSAALSINIRGLTGVHGNDTFLALLDGIPFVSAHEEVLFSEIPIGAVERVEVVRGPVSALYGRGALSGAINYITKKPGTSQAYEINLSVGSYGFARPHFQASLPTGEHNLLVDGYVESSDGWREQTQRDATHILIKDEFTIGGHSRFELFGNFFKSQHGAGGQIPLGSQGEMLSTQGGREGFIGYEPNEYDRSSTMFAIRHAYVSGALTLETTFHARFMEDQNHLNFFDPFGFDQENNVLRVNGFENQRDTTVMFLEPCLIWEKDSHNFVAGINLENVKLEETDWWYGQNGLDFDTFDYYFYEINIDYESGEILNLDHPLWSRDETYRGDSTNTFLAFYVQDEWNIGSSTQLTMGLRYDQFKRKAQIDSDIDFDGTLDENPEIEDKEGHLSPKLALRHGFSEDFHGYLSYGQGFNSNFGAVWQWDPGLYERGQDVPPSTVNNVEGGLSFHKDRWSLQSSLFRLIQKDRLVFVPNPNGFGPARASAAGEFQSSGLELQANMLFKKGSIQFGYSFVDAKWNDFSSTAGDFDGKRPIGVPEHTLSLQFRGQINPTWSYFGSFQAFDDYAVTLDNEVIDGAYSLADIGIKWSFFKNQGALQLVCKNLFDEEYNYLFGSAVPYNATPGLPRHIMGNLKFKF